MAFARSRWNENAAGMTGFGRMAFYDGSGRDLAASAPQADPPRPNEGGDTLATIKGNGFFNDRVVRDAIRESISQLGIGPHFNAGLIVLLRGNDGMEIDILYEINNEVRVRGTGSS